MRVRLVAGRPAGVELGGDHLKGVERLGREQGLAALAAKLKAINEKLWVVEDDIRDHERAKNFDAKFIELARAVYYTNDERANVKREINTLLGSALIEEKSYAAY